MSKSIFNLMGVDVFEWQSIEEIGNGEGDFFTDVKWLLKDMELLNGCDISVSYGLINSSEGTVPVGYIQCSKYIDAEDDGEYKAVDCRGSLMTNKLVYSSKSEWESLFDLSTDFILAILDKVEPSNEIIAKMKEIVYDYE